MNWVKHDKGDACPVDPGTMVEVCRRVNITCGHETGPAASFNWMRLKGKGEAKGLDDIIAYRPVA